MNLKQRKYVQEVVYPFKTSEMEPDDEKRNNYNRDIRYIETKNHKHQRKTKRSFLELYQATGPGHEIET